MRKLVALALLAACSHPTIGTLRFEVAPPVTEVADRTPLPTQPPERDYNRTLYHVDGFVVRRATRAMEMANPVRAQDVNALDEAPNSTWFTNRIGMRDLSIDELTRNANVDPSPTNYLPWTITGAKIGGTAIGFIFKDAKGDKYLLKFDLAERPEMETGAHMMGHAIVWAAGYNVPEDYIANIKRSDLVVSPTATKKDAFGKKHPVTDADLDEALTHVFRAEDGTIRVLASRFLPGVPVGPYAREGTRSDDPNDLVPHERRRTIRGQVPLFSWINHTDMQEDNSLDAFILHPGPDGEKSKAGHIVHYLIDWGKAFGVMGFGLGWKTVGYTYRLDLAKMLSSLVTLGLRERSWDSVSAPSAPKLRGLGLFESAHFDPSEWRPNSLYWPYEDIDQFDGFWGAKIVMRFTRPQIEAIVAQAQFSDPETSAYFVRVLIERQAKIGRYWFRQVSPLDTFTVQGGQLCFDDLGLRYGLEHPRATQVLSSSYDGTGKLLRAETGIAATAAHTCVDLVLGGGATAYTIVRLRVKRNAIALPPVLVHIARDPSGKLAVIGVRRE